MNDSIKSGGDINAGDGGYSVSTKEKYDRFVNDRNQSLGKMRIRELAEKCWSHRVDGALVDGQLHFDQQKFAELIVKECAMLVETYQDKNTFYRADFTIKQHFGVEE